MSLIKEIIRTILFSESDNLIFIGIICCISQITNKNLSLNHIDDYFVLEKQLLSSSKIERIVQKKLEQN
jgi:hypothetical protein